MGFLASTGRGIALNRQRSDNCTEVGHALRAHNHLGMSVAVRTSACGLLKHRTWLQMDGLVPRAAEGPPLVQPWAATCLATQWQA